MGNVWRIVRSLGLLLPLAAVQAQPLSYEPVALGWSAAEVERAAQGQWQALQARARDTGPAACGQACQRVQAVYERLLPLARQQSAHAAGLAWRLLIVRLTDVEAMAMPGGQLVVGEDFVEAHAPEDEALAFVLAHEMAHSILEHERQALSFARQLLPREVPRSVRDMYVELDFNFSLLKAMEPVLQQGEFEADELGLLLAARAGFDPQRQLRFMERLAAQPATRRALVASHPPQSQRLQRLRELLPLAERLHRMR
jgi:predicted Zn-dependent protease